MNDNAHYDELIQAAKNGNKQLVDYLATTNKDWNMVLVGALMRAAIENKMDMLKYAVSNGANINYSFEYMLFENGLNDYDHNLKINDDKILNLCKHIIKDFHADISWAFAQIINVTPVSFKLCAFILKNYFIKDLKRMCLIMEHDFDHNLRDELLKLVEFAKEIENANLNLSDYKINDDDHQYDHKYDDDEQPLENILQLPRNETQKYLEQYANFDSYSKYFDIEDKIRQLPRNETQKYLEQYTKFDSYSKYFDIEDKIRLFPNARNFSKNDDLNRGMKMAAKYGNKNLVDYFAAAGVNVEYALIGGLLRALLYKNKDMVDYAILIGANAGNSFNYIENEIVYDRDYKKIDKNLIFRLCKYLLENYHMRTKHWRLDVYLI